MLRIQKISLRQILLSMALAFSVGGIVVAEESPQRVALSRGSLPDFKNMPAPSLERAQAMTACLEQQGVARPPAPGLSEEEKAAMESCRQEGKSNRQCLSNLKIGPFASDKVAPSNAAGIFAALENCRQQLASAQE